MAKVRSCQRCGCTDARACPGGCFWMPAPLVDVCSACATQVEVDAAANRAQALERRLRKRQRAAAAARRAAARASR